ncbi:MAG: rhodanese-like domain-containing protein [Oligoflexia bacterium]|nr:rhodanese-like domain-containing protein [Oligoflexia bacterium]
MFVKKQTIFFVSCMIMVIFAFNDIGRVFASDNKISSYVEEIDTTTANLLLKKGVDLVVDLRSVEEFNREHLKSAVNIPIEMLDDNLNKIMKYRGKKVLIYCNTTNKSRIAVQKMLKNGFKKIKVILGGYQEWKQNGFELVK